MPRPKPPPRTLAPEDERKIQSFLERAAPIVLESRIVDAQTWEKLSELAAEVELSADQLRETMEDLRQRGVIQKVDVRPPKPPPLPDHSDAESSDATDRDTTEFEQEFALSAPPPIPKSSAPGPPPRVPIRSVPAPGPAREAFSRRVREIIAEQRGLGPNAHPLLAAAAEDFGLSGDEMREIIRGESSRSRDPGPRSDPPKEPVESDDESVARRRWRVEGEPPPEPAPAKKKPNEIFEVFVEQSFDKCGGDRVPREVETRVINHGVRVLKLVEVYARQIVAAVAERKKLVLDSQPSVAKQGEPELTPQEQQFRDRAASILAKHRGINAKSKVLLNALAAELGLDDKQTEEAVASLQGRPDAEAARQEEQSEARLKAFRKHLAIALAKLPRGILLANTSELLVEQGHERYGLDIETARATVKATAADLKLSHITNDQATEHVQKLVDQMLGDGLRLRPEMRERVMSEAGQWGLAAEDADKIIQGRTRENYCRKRAEQQFASRAVMAGACAVTLVLAFVGWMLMVGISPEPEPPSERDLAAQLRELQPEPDRDDSWWSAELAVALAKCRLEFHPLRLTLDQIRATSGSQRAAAYERLVGRLLGSGYDDEQRLLLLESLSRCYALDPDDAAAVRLGESLLATVPRPDQSLADDPALYANAFWGLRVAVASLAESAAANKTFSAARTAKLSELIREGIGARVEADQPRRELERSCLGALAEHLFHLLIVSVEAQPMTAGNLHRVIATEAAKYLDRTLLDQLNADYLLAIFRRGTEQWQDYKELIQQTIFSVEPLAVVKTIELFESTGSEDLRAFMEPLLRVRTRVQPRPQEIPELAESFRQSLGIRSDSTLAGRQKKYARFVRATFDNLRGSADQPRRLLTETAKLAWLESLGCALGIQDARAEEAFRRLAKEPAEITGSLPASHSASTDVVETDSGKARLVRGYVNRLSNSSWFTRATYIAQLAQISNEVADVSPTDALRLADYMLGLKPPEERQAVLKAAGKLGRWQQLRLAVADRLEQSKLPLPQIREIVMQLLDSRVDLPIGLVATVEDYRWALLQSALEVAEPAGTAEEKATLLDACRQALLEQYLAQLRLLSVAEPSIDVQTQLSAVLELVIEAHAKQLGRGSLSKQARRQLEMIPHQFDAIHFYARNDLHRTLLLERLLLSLLAMTADNDVFSEVDLIVERLRKRDQDARGLLVQLHSGHQALAEAWFLLSGAKESR